MPVPADYIVEQETSGIWTYRKWNSGIAECWGRYTSEENTIFSDVWDNNNINSTIIKTNYPFAFAETPIENCRILASKNACWQYSESNPEGLNSTTKTGGYRAIRNSSTKSTSNTIYADFYVIGKWK